MIDGYYSTSDVKLVAYLLATSKYWFPHFNEYTYWESYEVEKFPRLFILTPIPSKEEIDNFYNGTGEVFEMSSCNYYSFLMWSEILKNIRICWQ